MGFESLKAAGTDGCDGGWCEGGGCEGGRALRLESERSGVGDGTAAVAQASIALGSEDFFVNNLGLGDGLSPLGGLLTTSAASMLCEPRDD